MTERYAHLAPSALAKSRRSDSEKPTTPNLVAA